MFRMSKEEFIELCEQLRPIISKSCIISKLQIFQIAEYWSKMFLTMVINLVVFQGWL